MHFSISFLVASLSKVAAKPLSGVTGDGYSDVFNNGIQRSARGSVVGAQDAFNQYLVEPLPDLTILGARPVEISAASAGLDGNPYGEPGPVPSVQQVKPIEIGATDANLNKFFGATTNLDHSPLFDEISVSNPGPLPNSDTLFVPPVGGNLITLENMERTTWIRDMSKFRSPGNNPCGGQDQNLGCCNLTYSRTGDDFVCDNFHKGCPANRVYCCPMDEIREYRGGIKRTCEIACPRFHPNAVGQASGTEISDNCKTPVQA